jgi:hypothetical protein
VHLDWLPLGSVQLSTDWQVLPVESESKLFRAKLTCSNFELLVRRGSVAVKQVFEDEDVGDIYVRRLSLHGDRQLIKAEIHPDFLSRGLVTRRMAVRRTWRRFNPFYTEPPLFCEIEGLI